MNKTAKILIMLIMLTKLAFAENGKSMVTVDALNSGEVIIIGKLGSPIGTYHDIVASFGMPVDMGRAGQGGQILLKVTEVDGKALKTPIWMPYFKSITLQDYLLPDGTNLFPQHPNTHTLTGKTVSCRVYEDIAILRGGDHNLWEDKTKKTGFDKVVYKSMLGIISIKGAKE